MNLKVIVRSLVVSLCLLTAELSTAVLVAEESYDPLAVNDGVTSLLSEFRDAKRDRIIPLKIYLPPKSTATSSDSSPLVIFSHGLGGSRENSKYLGEHFAGRGYVSIFVQHAGSDEALWKEGPLLGRIRAMTNAASLENLVLRCEDVIAVLDAIEIWNADSKHLLYKRVDMEHVGMCGHSFGAQTTQAVGGQSFPLVGQRYFDKRIDAAIAFSPGAPADGKNQAAFSKVSIPWMLMTGTEDKSPIGTQTVATRLQVYSSLPSSIDRYEIVLFKAAHSVFSDRLLPTDSQQRNPNHHPVILALSTAFWDSYLKSSSAAKAWLTGAGPKAILEDQDRWQFQLK